MRKTKFNNEQPSRLLIGNFSFLIPVREYFIDFDVTTKNSVSAFLETSLALILTLETISPYELQVFFGLTEDEREALIREIELSDYAVFTSSGALQATEKLRNAKEKDGKFYLEKVESRTAKFYIDLYTNHIQTNRYKAFSRNFLQLPGKDTRYNPEEIFRDEFSRFIEFSKYDNIEKYNTKLYRVNDCFYTSTLNMPISLNFYLETLGEQNFRITYDIFDDEDEKKTLIQNSGVMKYLHEFLNNKEINPPLVSFNQFCNLINEKTLLSYTANKTNKINLNLFSQNTNYTFSKHRNSLRGEISLPSNRKTLFDWLDTKKMLEPVFWRPASSSLWGTSIFLKSFYSELSDMLKRKSSSLHLFFPQSLQRDNDSYKFHTISDKLYFCPTSEELDEIEILIVPGKHCWAMIQYYANIEPNNEYPAIKIPIGYTTTNPLEVEEIWNIFKAKINYNEKNFLIEVNKKEVEKRVLDWLL